MLDLHRGKGEWRRLCAELLGTFMLVFVAAGVGMVNAKLGGTAIPPFIQAIAPALAVMSIILSLGAISGAHLNPVVSLAFALRGDFPWQRVPPYVAAQFAGAILAMLRLAALLGREGTAGLTLPGMGVSATAALLWEMLLTAGLVSVVLYTSSGAKEVGLGTALCVGGYIAPRYHGWRLGERCRHEYGKVARAGHRALAFHGLVGLPARASRRGAYSRGHRLRMACSAWQRASASAGVRYASLALAAVLRY